MAARGISRIKWLVIFLNICCIISFLVLIGQSSRKRYPWEEQQEIADSATFDPGKLTTPTIVTELNSSKPTDLPKEHIPKQVQSVGDKPSDLPREHIPKQFQPVGDSIQTFVYSAFYDDVETAIIRVIALVRELNKTADSHKYTCTYPPDVRVDGPLQYVREPRWGYSYRSAMILCALPSGSRPDYVTVNQHGTTGAGNELKVGYPLHRKYNLTRCFTAVHSNFNNTIQFMQTMELSLMFGVEHFVVYNYSISPNVLAVMEKYREMGILDIMPWALPINRTHIHYYAQLTAIQECLYRNLHVSDYILTGDTDEVFVPKTTQSSLQIIKSYFKGHQSCSCLVIRNAFFPLNLPPHHGDYPFKSEAENLKLTYLMYTSHTKIFSAYDRSKLVIKPTGVEVGGIHGIEKYRKGRTGCLCATKECLLHHYRSLNKQEMSSFRQTDTSIHKYSKELTLRISDRLRQWGLY